MTRQVAAIVLHRGGDTYLAQSVRSLLGQRRRLDEIVVAHQGRGAPPSWLRDRFPGVAVVAPSTPATAAAVVQEIIRSSGADLFLFQDSSGWSAPGRLGALLDMAEGRGAGVVGSDYVLLDPRVPDARTRTLPRDGALAHQLGAGERVVEPYTMLVDRAAVERLGGFNTRLTVAAGDEFVARAAVTGRVVNVPRVLYFQRETARSDWSAEENGGSLRARVALGGLRERSRRHVVALAGRQVPDVALRMRRDPVELVRLVEVTGASSAASAAATGGTGAMVETDGRSGPGHVRSAGRAPVFVVSASDSLARFVACSLGQHAHLTSVDVSSWIVEVASTAARFASTPPTQDLGDGVAGSASFGDVFRSASAAVDAMFARGSAIEEPPVEGSPDSAARWVGALPAEASTLMAAAVLYPDAAFVHVVWPVDRAVAARLGAVGDVDVEVAYEAWLANLTVILDVFQLLDARRIHTVEFGALRREPIDVLRSLLEVLGEPLDERCVDVFQPAPVAIAGPEPIPDLPGVPAQLAARRLSLALSGVSAAGDQERTRLLVKALASAPPAVTDPVRRRTEREDDGRNPYRASHELIRRYAPQGATVCVVSKGDEMAVRIPNHSVAWHFPRTDDGEYVGYHPREACDAIAHLEELRERGADLLLVPRVYGWWLDHYIEFRNHLERTYRRVPATPDEGTLYDLRARPMTTEPGVAMIGDR